MLMKKNSDFNEWKFVQKEDKKKQNLFDRFFDRIKNSFQKNNKESEEQRRLSGRIQDLHVLADQVLGKLEEIRTILKTSHSHDIYTYVHDYIDIITKEVKRNSLAIDLSKSVTSQAKAFKRYNLWLEKAKLWIHICSHMNNQDKMEQEIIHYMVRDFLEVIDRDLQVIDDYQEHMVNDLALNEDEKIDLALMLESKLDPYIKSLYSLRTVPKQLSLKEVAEWKKQIDAKREKYFDAALHAIDKLIEESNPSILSDFDGDHLMEALSEIVFLENEIPNLHDEIYIVKGHVNKSLLNKLQALENKAHELNLNLRLTPDLIDRLQSLIKVLQEIRGLV